MQIADLRQAKPAKLPKLAQQTLGMNHPGWDKMDRLWAGKSGGSGEKFTEGRGVERFNRFLAHLDSLQEVPYFSVPAQ